jgi:hypothetical protein
LKKIILSIVSGLIALTVACGGGSDESDNSKSERLQKKMMEKMGASASEINEMQQNLKEMSKNVKKIEEEKAQESEEDKKVFSDKDAALLGLSETTRKIADTEWQKASVLQDAYKKLSNEQLRGLTREKIETMITDAGFADMESAQKSLREIADTRDLIISVNMKIGMLKSTRFLDGDDEYQKEMKELGNKINKKGYSIEDLRAMDQNIKIATTATEVLYRLNN